MPVMLTCWSLDTGAGTGSGPYLFPVDTQIAPGQYLIIEKVLPVFPLPRSGGLRLLDGYGEVVIKVNYAIAEDAVGSARIPDGTGDWVNVSTRTKGSSNETPTPTPRPVRTSDSNANGTEEPSQGAVSRAPTRPVPRLIRITEIYYDGQTRRTEGDEFIEIQNQGTAVAYLVRLRIHTQSATARSPVTYGFPSGTTLSPGEIIVIAKNARQFAAYFGRQPDFEARASGAGYHNTADVPNLVHDRRVSRRTWALANSGATVALMSDTGDVIDVVAYGYDPAGYLGLRGVYPSAAGGQSLRRIFAEGISPHSPAAVREDAPSPGTIPPPTPTPTQVPVPTPTVEPSPTAAPTPSPTPPTPTPTATPSPTPTPAPTPTAIPPTPTPRPTATPPPTPAPTATPPPPPPTPTPKTLHCLTDISRLQSPQRVVVAGIVTEVRSLPAENLVFLADNCGGAILHLSVGVSLPPAGSHIRFTAFASRSDTRIDLHLTSDTRIERLSGRAPPQAISFMRALVGQATTGTRVQTAGRIIVVRDFDGREVYQGDPSYVRLDPQARAIPVGTVDFYGIIEWRESAPLLRVHFVAPRAAAATSLKETVLDWSVSRKTVRVIQDVLHYLVSRSLKHSLGAKLP